MTTTQLGIDLGNGAIKLYGPQGGIELPSQVALNGTQKILETASLRKIAVPLTIKNRTGSYYTGLGAHYFGHLIENFDTTRNEGSAELLALFHAGLTLYDRQFGLGDTRLSIALGLPNEALTGESAPANLSKARAWAQGRHTWEADGRAYQVDIADVKIASQAAGAYLDYALDDSGQLIPERKAATKGEIGVISIGFGTVEVMGVDNKALVQKYTAGASLGVRRLLEMVDGERHYSPFELDEKLRAGRLQVREHLPAWASQVNGFVEKRWGTDWKRFAAILVVGGGALLLREALLERFNGKIFLPDQPVFSVARGLHRFMRSQQVRAEKA
jgi:hypothetical protein